MSKLLRAVAVGAAVMVGVLAMPVPANANSAKRDATISTQENVAGMTVLYNARVDYMATTPGVATIACSTIVVDVPIDTPTSICWLEDLDTHQTYFAYDFPYFQSSYNAQTFVINRPSRLRVCLYVTFTYATGPTRCANL